MAKRNKKTRKFALTDNDREKIRIFNHKPEFDADTVGRATRAVITGWLAGDIHPFCSPWHAWNGDLCQCYMVIVKPEAVRKMLKRERNG